MSDTTNADIIAAIADLKGHVERQGTIHLENHQRVVSKLDEYGHRIGSLESKLGTPSAPPPGAVAVEAKRLASNASLEAAAVEGRLLAFAASSDARLARLETSVAANNEWTHEIRDFVRGITTSKAVRAAAVGLVLTVFGALGAIIQGVNK
jgi:hypothetical protein